MIKGHKGHHSDPWSRLVLARVRKNGERSSYVVLQSSFSILNASAIDGFWERFTVSSLGAVPFFAGQITQSRVHHNLKERKMHVPPSVRPSVRHDVGALIDHRRGTFPETEASWLRLRGLTLTNSIVSDIGKVPRTHLAL